MDHLLPLLVGFSIGMSALLVLALSTVYRGIELPWPARLGGYVMLAGLASTQWSHLQLAAEPEAGVWRGYVVVVFMQSVGFYWLLLGVLRRGRWRAVEGLLPLAVLAAALITPLQRAVPLSLLLGTVAATHLGVLAYRLRAMRRWFALELKVIALFAVMGAVLAIGALFAPGPLGWAGFAHGYTVLIAIGFMLVGWLLLAVSDIVPKAREAVASAYVQSTLGSVDRAAAAARLRGLFEQEHVHRDADLDLAGVAELMALSSHQLSELVNSEFQLSFPRFVRQYRIAEARRMLVEEPKASVLSVALAVGFASQSSFYVAFKDEVGRVPSQYRADELTAAAPTA
jgi:AraC-like DNA-binding protein